MRFRITYTDPETGEEVRVVREFVATPNVSAELWAEDWAYAVSRKGPYKVELIGDQGRESPCHK